MQNKNQTNDSPVFSRTANAAGMARGAAKTGKALAAATKGAAGGPYGMAAAELIEKRKTIGKVIVAVVSILLLPIVYILMLPSLIFGDLGLDSAAGNVLKDNTIIIKNISNIEDAVETILQDKHDEIMDEIKFYVTKLDVDSTYDITDYFSSVNSLYASSLIISQFCASQKNYKEINKKKLIKTLESNIDDLFSYSVTITEDEVPDEATDDMKTIRHYQFVINYAGESYFADNVFKLNKEQKATAKQYATNLYLFLLDI